jgi:hypothetical protein
MDVGFNGNVRRNDGFNGEGSIFLPTVIEFHRPDSSHGFSVCSLGLTPFPPNKDGDDYGGQQGFAEKERNYVAVLPQPG